MDKDNDEINQIILNFITKQADIYDITMSVAILISIMLEILKECKRQKEEVKNEKSS